MTSPHFKTRYRIIESLYKKNEEDPGFPLNQKQLSQQIGVSDSELELNVRYLEEKGLIRCSWTGGTPRNIMARINAHGMDVYENQEEFLPQFPFLKINVNIQEIKGSVIGPVIQGERATVITIQPILDSFNKIRETIQAKDISEEKKNDILYHINTLEKETQKEQPDASIIERSYNWLKRNADWVVPTLTQILIEALNRHQDILKLLK